MSPRLRASTRLRTTLRVLFVIVGLTAMAVALVAAVRDPDLRVVPSPAAIATAVVVVVIGLWCSTVAWARLLDRPVSRRLARGFFIAQFGKYVPGGVWQAIGQVADAAEVTKVGGPAATAAFAASVLTTVTAGMTTALPAITSGAAPLWLRLVLPVAAAVSVGSLLRPRWMSVLVERIGPLRRRLSLDDMPERGRLVQAWLWSVPSMVATGVVYAIALHATTGDVVFLAVPAYIVAWTLGFLAIPFPAGLGVRESLLVVLLPGLGTVEIVAAAAVLRLIYIGAESLALVTAIPVGGPRRRGGSRSRASDRAASSSRTGDTGAGGRSDGD